jgi:hypothetical protein
MRHVANYMSTHTTAIDTRDLSTIWLSKDTHSTAWLGAENPSCLQNILLCCKSLVLPIL